MDAKQCQPENQQLPVEGFDTSAVEARNIYSVITLITTGGCHQTTDKLYCSHLIIDLTSRCKVDFVSVCVWGGGGGSGGRIASVL